MDMHNNNNNNNNNNKSSAATRQSGVVYFSSKTGTSVKAQRQKTKLHENEKNWYSIYGMEYCIIDFMVTDFSNWKGYTVQ